MGSAVAPRRHTAINGLQVDAYTIPTERPESDGTLEWTATTMVVVHVTAGDRRGIGYTYSPAAAAQLIHERLREIVIGADPLAIEGTWSQLVRDVRNAGRPGIAATAISAVDAALWDLKAKLLDLPLVALLGQVRPAIPVYGSGGFTSLDLGELHDQLAGWRAAGLPAVKMKVGRKPSRDVARVRAAREAIGDDVSLYVDANGAFATRRAIALAAKFAESGVSRFEEPVSSDDVQGVRFVRERVPPAMQVAAGEYIYDVDGARALLSAGAVDILQADATRSLGITGFLKVAALAEAFHIPLSSHTAPALHLHPCCAVTPARDLEWFHDHVRIERMLFDGAAEPDQGMLAPDLSRPGMGVALRVADADRFAVH